jgi:hypothetical protein
LTTKEFQFPDPETHLAKGSNFGGIAQSWGKTQHLGSADFKMFSLRAELHSLEPWA